MFSYEPKSMAYTTPGETRSKVLAYMHKQLTRGEAPTVREVQQAFGFSSVGTARAHLEALVAERKLSKLPGRSRGYRLPSTQETLSNTGSITAKNNISSTRAVRVPLVGRVAAGSLHEAIEAPDGYIFVSAKLRGEHFALRVEGESMVNAGILPGDIVVVRRQSHAHDGDIVVARDGDQATVKTLRLRHGAVVLEPANPAFSPIVFTHGELVIVGKVIELRRTIDPHH